MNDKKMIENCGLGIVMKNSALYTKKIGDFITEDHNSNGVEKAIYQYIKWILHWYYINIIFVLQAGSNCWFGSVFIVQYY